jgi:hypothetical protein
LSIFRRVFPDRGARSEAIRGMLKYPVKPGGPKMPRSWILLLARVALAAGDRTNLYDIYRRGVPGDL